MGNIGRKRRKTEQEEVAIKHLKTLIKTSIAHSCKRCPLRLYNDKDYTITLGVGNIQAGKIIILPKYDTNAKIGYLSILKILEEEYNKITSNLIYEDYYITRQIKCYSYNNFNMDLIARECCKDHLLYEIIRIRPKLIINFDKDLDFPECGIRKIDVISPAVIYYDNQSLKDKFVEQLSKAIYDTDLCV